MKNKLKTKSMIENGIPIQGNAQAIKPKLNKIVSNPFAYLPLA